MTPIPDAIEMDGLPPEWGISRPKTEKEIGEYFDARFSGRFEIYREIYLKHPTSGRLRVDRILKEREGRVGGLWAVELKRLPRENDSFTGFTASLAQILDETQSRVESDIFGTDWFGRQLRFAFLFPCPFQIYEFQCDYRSIGIPTNWAHGALKLASKFGVGAISYSVRNRDWGFFLGGHPIYWLERGPTCLAHKHAVALRKGSAR